MLNLLKEVPLIRDTEDLYLQKALELKLPIPDVDSAILQSLGSHSNNRSDDDVESSYYLEHVATNGSISISSNSSHISYRSISWRALYKNRVIELEPIDLNMKNSARRKVRLISSLDIRTNCITIIEDPKDDTVCIDFLVEQGFLYTVVLPLKIFIDDTVRLNDHNASQWRSIKAPFSFDIKKPHIMKAVSPSILIVALQDGGLIKLERDSTSTVGGEVGKLSEITTSLFVDSKGGLSLGKLISWNSTDRVAGTNISIRTVASLDYCIESDTIVGLCINRTLRIWSLSTLQLINEQPIPGPSLAPGPCRFISLETNIRAATSHLAVYIPGGDGQKGSFKIYQYNYGQRGQETGTYLVDLGHDFETPELLPEDGFSLWNLSDLCLVNHGDHFKLWTLWKSDLNSSVRYFNFPLSSGSPHRGWILGITEGSSTLMDQNEWGIAGSITSEDLSELFIKKIFGPSGYSLKTISAALPIYCQHYNTTIIGSPSDSLQEKVICNIAASVSVVSGSTGPGFTANDYMVYRKEVGQHWLKFDRLCLELEKQANEVFSMTYDRNLDFMWISRASHVSVLRRMTDIEIYAANQAVAPSKHVVHQLSRTLDKEPVMVERVLRLLAALFDFRKNLSKYILQEVDIAFEKDYSESCDSQLVTERIAFLYQRLLENQLTETSIGILTTAIFEIPEADSVIQTVFDAFSFEVSHTTGIITNSKNSVLLNNNTVSSLSMIGAEFSNRALNDCCVELRPIVIDLLLLLLLSNEQNDLINEYALFYPKYLELLKTFDAFLFVGGIFPKSIKYRTSRDMVSSLKDLSMSDIPQGVSPFEAILARTYKSLSITGSNVLFLFHYLFTQLNIMETPLARAIILVGLLTNGYYKECVEFANLYITTDDIFSTLVHGLVLVKLGYNQKASLKLRSVAISCATYRLNEQENSVLLHFSIAGNIGLGQGISAYYLWIAQIALEGNKNILALEFSKLAAETRSSDDKSLIHEIFLTWFHAGISTKAYEDSYNSIIELQLADLPLEKLVQCLDKFILSLIFDNKGYRLCQFPFIGLTHIVNDLLEEKMRSDSTSAKIPYHRIIYSWKIEKGDFRGGMCDKSL